MMRERVGDWRSVWRFALAGLVASMWVVATSQTAVVAPLYFGLQDQMFSKVILFDVMALVPFPTKVAISNNSTHRGRCTGKAVFDTPTQDDS